MKPVSLKDFPKPIKGNDGYSVYDPEQLREWKEQITSQLREMRDFYKNMDAEDYACQEIVMIINKILGES